MKNSHAQTKTYPASSLLERYDQTNISSWKSDSGIYRLSHDDNSLRIHYRRSGADEERWQTFVFNPSNEIDISKKPVITLTIKSSADITLSLKPFLQNRNSPLFSCFLSGDNVWRTISFNLHPGIFNQIKTIFFYLDGGLIINKEGTIWIKKITIGYISPTQIYPDWREFDNAMHSARSLLINSIEGLEKGQFKSGSKSILESTISGMRTFRESRPESQDIINKAVEKIYNACVLFETSANKADTELNDHLATKETGYLYLNLQRLKTKKLLFGMQNTTGVGVNWSGEDDRSDIKDICGEYPAIFGEDLILAELDSSPERLKYRITKAYNSGSIITLSWHQYDPELRGAYAKSVKRKKIIESILPGGKEHEEYKNKLEKLAGFFKSLRGKKGESIPVIFRPFHEHSSRTFWWGTSSCTPSEFRQIWQFTQKYLRDSLNVHNLIYAISPTLQQVDSNKKYFKRYPGDSYVDILGADFYFKWYYTSSYAYYKFNKGLKILSSHAIERSKIAALTETGVSNLKLENWFTKILHIWKSDPLVSNVVYMMIWNNINDKYHFAPYPGHESAKDFLNFYNDPHTIFQQDLPDMYANPLP